MSVLTVDFLFDVESSMRALTTERFSKLTGNLWWRKVAKEMPSRSKKEVLTWLIDSARLNYSVEGQAQFMDMGSAMQELENRYFSGDGLRLLKSQFDDLDGGGVDAAAHWSRQMGELAAVFPQQELSKAIIANPKAYDGGVYFRTNHPVNPIDASFGTYANDFTGSASGGYPGARPISGVTTDVAQANIAKAIAYIRSIKAPNGVNPRGLRAVKILVPPALQVAALNATKAVFIASAAQSGGGSQDASHVVNMFNLEVIVADELAGTMPGGSDTTYYLIAEDVGGELGAFVHQSREPFSITYHNITTSAELARMRQLEWLPHGRCATGPGHPFLMYRCQAT